MGISGFFSYFKLISQGLPNDKQFIIPLETTYPNVSHLYIDFVSMIFDVKDDFSNDIEKIPSQGEKEIFITQKIVDRLEKIFSQFPNAKVYIFFECNLCFSAVS
jgi:hypothetical protein